MVPNDVSQSEGKRSENVGIYMNHRDIRRKWKASGRNSVRTGGHDSVIIRHRMVWPSCFWPVQAEDSRSINVSFRGRDCYPTPRSMCRMPVYAKMY